MTLSASTGRDAVRELVDEIRPFDEQETADLDDVLAWIASGAELYRRVPPADPPKHLVTYFLPYHAGTDTVFLVKHRKAGLWLPPGVHLASPVSETVLSATDRGIEAACVRGLRLGY